MIMKSLDARIVDWEYIYSYEKTPEFDNCFRISGEVYLTQEVVKVK